MSGQCLHSFSAFVKCLEKADFSRLPGHDAQMRMAPAFRLEEIEHRGGGKHAVKSSVLLLFFPLSDGKPGTVMIQRPEYNGAHGGQISFPGGRYEASDPDLAFTALRETHEEIGVDPGRIKLVGRLTDLYIPPSNFVVSPFVGIASERPVFKPDPSEVAEILEFSTSHLFEPSCRTLQAITLSNGRKISTPCFYLRGRIIWGATAMIVSEFMELLECL